MNANTEVYFGYLSFTNRDKIQDNLRVQDVLYDTKDFFDRALEVDEFVELSLGNYNSLKHGSIKSSVIDGYDINDSHAVISCRSYARNANFKGLANYLKEQIRTRGKDYSRLLDGLKMEFVGNYMMTLSNIPRLLAVEYELDFIFNEQDDTIDIKFNVINVDEKDLNAGTIRLATSLFAVDNYTERGLSFIQRLIKDVVSGKYNDSEYPEINTLVVEVKKFMLSSMHLFENIDELLKKDNLEYFFKLYPIEKTLTIGVEDTLKMLLGYKDLVLKELTK